MSGISKPNQQNPGAIPSCNPRDHDGLPQARTLSSRVSNDPGLQPKGLQLTHIKAFPPGPDAVHGSPTKKRPIAEVSRSPSSPHPSDPKGPEGSSPSPPSPPMVNPSELEKDWEAWTKEGLTSICGLNKIVLVSTTKPSIIKALVAGGVKFWDPPANHRAPSASKPTTPPPAQKKPR